MGLKASPTTTLPLALTPRASLKDPDGGKPRPVTVPLTQRTACTTKPLVLKPTTTVPSAFTPEAELAVPPGRKPRPVAVPLTQRTASEPPGPPGSLVPTTTVPSALTPVAVAKPRPVMVPLTQRKACLLTASPTTTRASPTTTVPSAFTPWAELELAPGKKPRPWNLCSLEVVGVAVASAVTAVNARSRRFWVAV